MSLKNVLRAVLLTLCATVAAAAEKPAVRRRALLIGINDYTASRLQSQGKTPVPGREWLNLAGSVNDVAAMREMLIHLYDFRPEDIHVLVDQNATRVAILRAIHEYLVAGASKGDVLFFYYAGHGSQVKNSLSDEPDKMDESIVPADSQLGADDIRDKELRHLFNRSLDRGARLTVILDSCNSGSGARGVEGGAQWRGLKPDPRDVADRTAGPRPENRGALVISAAQDTERANETRDEEGARYGAFTWAWLHAVAAADENEPAVETFLRAQARLRAETPFQVPVIAGNDAARYTPFLGTRRDRRDGRAVIAVQEMRADGTVRLQGGWANGLAVGTQLRIGSVRLTVTAVHGLGQSDARIEHEQRAAPQRAVESGMLAEVVGWAAPPGRPLRVWLPRVPDSPIDTARALVAEAARRKLRWIADPTATQPSHQLRWTGSEWELIASNGDTKRAGADPVAALASIPSGSSLFVQFPVAAGLAKEIPLDAAANPSIEAVSESGDADYILIGRFHDSRLQYAWVRPSARKEDAVKTGLPVRTKWTDSAPRLQDAVVRLRKIRAWHLLESPRELRFPYRLVLRRSRTSELVTKPHLIGGETYGALLRAATSPPPKAVSQRFVYLFMIDSHGNSVLLHPAPNSGSVENRVPPDPDKPAAEIPLGPKELFEVSEPYGVDTYFLLSTAEALPNPAILQWEGVRGSYPPPRTALEELLMLTETGTRSAVVLPRAAWSIERLIVESSEDAAQRVHRAEKRRHDDFR